MLNDLTLETPSSRHEYLEQLWKVQLNRPTLGSDDDFFESGGSSMQVIEMLTAVSDRFGVEIDYEEFFRDPCLRKLDELLKSA